jgi:hypothetical protein
VNAPAAYAGVTPGDPGLYQVNAVAPSGIATGENAPVQIIATLPGQSPQARQANFTISVDLRLETAPVQTPEIAHCRHIVQTMAQRGSTR